MIDFRYHLISIIAVFLALAIGVVLGSGLFGSPLLRSLRHHVDQVQRINDSLKNENSDLRQTIAGDRKFAEALEPHLIDGALAGQSVVVVDVGGTSGGLVGDLSAEVTSAGGTVESTIDLTDKFALSGAPDRDQLGLVLETAPRKVSTLRARAGETLGQRMGGAANPPGRGGIAGDVQPQERINTLLASLSKAGFVGLHTTGTGTQIVPAGSVFLVVAGDPNPPPFNVENLLLPLVRHISAAGAAVTVAAPTDSSWTVVPAIRSDPRAANDVSTVDNADEVEGRIAAVLSLARPQGQAAGAYGTGPGTEALPTPLPGA